MKVQTLVTTFSYGSFLAEVTADVEGEPADAASIFTPVGFALIAHFGGSPDATIRTDLTPPIDLSALIHIPSITSMLVWVLRREILLTKALR